MDALLSLVMSNLGFARPGTWVYDPFVGSGMHEHTSADFYYQADAHLHLFCHWLQIVFNSAAHVLRTTY